MSKDIIIEQLRQFKEQRGSFYGIVMLGLFGSVAGAKIKKKAISIYVSNSRDLTASTCSV